MKLTAILASHPDFPYLFLRIDSTPLNCGVDYLLSQNDPIEPAIIDAVIAFTLHFNQTHRSKIPLPPAFSLTQTSPLPESFGPMTNPTNPPPTPVAAFSIEILPA